MEEEEEAGREGRSWRGGPGFLLWEGGGLTSPLLSLAYCTLLLGEVPQVPLAPWPPPWPLSQVVRH